MSLLFMRILVSLAMAVMVASDHDRTEVSKEGRQLVPCLFIFGDSLADNGNNNFIFSFAKANYHPYGIDFSGGPTGRFSNGKTLMDVVAQLLGFKDEILPYTRAAGKDLLRGVNYASAAAGICDETGYHLGSRSSFRMQVNNYKSTVVQIVDLLGGENYTARYLNKCIFSIGIGSNDYLNNYFMPFLYPTSKIFTAQQYATLLIEHYSELLTTLYTFGARKFVLHGLGQIGCVPSILVRHSPDNRTCVEKFNQENDIFSMKLKELVDSLNKQQTDAKYIYINTTGIFSNLGFKVSNTACCGVGKNNAQITCFPFQNPCQNRKDYLFWDAFHPTEAANMIVGRRAFQAQETSDSHPMDIRNLAQLVIS